MSTQLATRPEHHIGPTQAAPAARPLRRVLVAVRWPVGGIRTHVLYNYPTLAEAGYRFTFVGPDDDTFRRFALSMACLPDSEFVGVSVRGQRCRMWPTLRRLLRSGRFALLHSHGLTAAVHGAVAAGRLPHLATVHDVFRPDQFVGWRGRIKRWLMGRLLRRTTALVLPGQDVHANLLEYLPVLGRGPCRLTVIPNGIDGEHHSRLPSGDLRGELNLRPGTALLGFLGRFMEQKGFLPLVEALRKLLAQGPPRPFHLVAFASGDRRNSYAAQVERAGLSPWVTLRDAVVDVQPILGQFDLLVMPSLWEAMPLLPMEAMAAGVPVLGSDCIGLREALQGTPSRMTRAGDVEDLARGLRDALACPWTEQARAFAPEARRRFDNAPSAQRLLELFGTCLAAARRAALPAA